MTEENAIIKEFQKILGARKSDYYSSNEKHEPAIK